jgi:hypothetical protein
MVASLIANSQPLECQARAEASSLTHVLFVDVDGVLHPVEATVAPSEKRVGPLGWLPGLGELLRPFPKVGVVLHSSWRLTYTAAELRDMLAWGLGACFTDVTCGGERYPSILAWLGAHPGASYRILDDDPTDFPQPAPLELIVCDPRLGVSSEQVRATLLAWLTE